jgi:uncharacterized protein (TIGR03086 family)
MSQPEIDLLESVLGETEAAIASVAPGQEHLPTPCTDFDVARVVDHLVGWANSFAARLTGGSVTGDPNDFRAGATPAAEFHHAGQAILAAYREGGEESQKLPIGILMMEFLVHGWDLAAATGSSVRFSSDAADLALATGRQMLAPEYRGPGKTFGDEVEVSDTAGPVDRLVAFLGRDPGWQGAPGLS